MREVKSGMIFKHFKGNMYKVLGVSNPVDVVYDASSYEIVEHTEKNDRFFTYNNGKNEYSHFKKHDTGVLVIYKQCGKEKAQIWARPIEMFLSEVDHEKYPGVEQKYRMEEVKDEQKTIWGIQKPFRREKRH